MCFRSEFKYEYMSWERHVHKQSGWCTLNEITAIVSWRNFTKRLEASERAIQRALWIFSYRKHVTVIIVLFVCWFARICVAVEISTHLLRQIRLQNHYIYVHSVYACTYVYSTLSITCAVYDVFDMLGLSKSE